MTGIGPSFTSTICSGPSRLWQHPRVETMKLNYHRGCNSQLRNLWHTTLESSSKCALWGHAPLTEMVCSRAAVGCGCTVSIAYACTEAIPWHERIRTSSCYSFPQTHQSISKCTENFVYVWVCVYDYAYFVHCSDHWEVATNARQ